MNSMAASAGRSSSFNARPRYKFVEASCGSSWRAVSSSGQGCSGLAFEQGCHTQTLASQGQLRVSSDGFLQNAAGFG